MNPIPEPVPDGAAHDRALAQLEALLEADPVNIDLRAEAFESALRAGRLDAARAHLEAARRLTGDLPPWTVREAHWLMAGRRWAQARTLLESLLDDPHLPDALRVVASLDIALASWQLGQPEAGLVALAPLVDESAEGAAPSPAVQCAWLRLSHVAGRAREALSRARHWRASASLGDEALGIASLAALDVEGPASALAMADQALAACPDQVEALTTRGSVMLAYEQPAAALKCLARALAARPEDGRILSAQAFALMMAGSLADAAVTFERALASMPGHVGTWHGLGWASLLQGRLVEARRAFERAITLDRGFAESHGSLAVVLAMTGHRGAASRSIEVAKRLDSSCVSADYAQAVLEGRASHRLTIEALVRRVTAASSRARGGGAAVN